MSDVVRVEVVSPEEMLYSGEATMVITRTLEGGEVAFQAGHASFLGALVENRTRLFLTDGTVQDIAVHGGFVEVSGTPTTVSILSDAAELAQDIDVEKVKADLERHELVLRMEHDEAKLTEAIAGKKVAEIQLETAGVTFTA
ncbi:MAG: ATP synthase F1 subunit epsilon [Ilumatobacteraceae bacterium]|nr:ATP synthase F1 subunit epsilon [Ilumatobacteraceae bacterium]